VGKVGKVKERKRNLAKAIRRMMDRVHGGLRHSAGIASVVSSSQDQLVTI
jgi:hypothetical protein